MLLHNPLFAIYASSVLTTAFNVGLILHQRKRLKRISLDVGYLEGGRADFAEEIAGIRAELEDIETRLAALENKHQRRLAA